MKIKDETAIRRYPMALRSIKQKTDRIKNLKHELQDVENELEKIKKDRVLYRNACVHLFETADDVRNKGLNLNPAYCTTYLTARFALGEPFYL